MRRKGATEEKDTPTNQHNCWVLTYLPSRFWPRPWNKALFLCLYEQNRCRQNIFYLCKMFPSEGSKEGQWNTLWMRNYHTRRAFVPAGIKSILIHKHTRNAALSAALEITLTISKGIVQSIYLDSLLTWCKEERGKMINGKEGKVDGCTAGNEAKWHTGLTINSNQEKSRSQLGSHSKDLGDLGLWENNANLPKRLSVVLHTYDTFGSIEGQN